MDINRRGLQNSFITFASRRWGLRALYFLREKIRKDKRVGGEEIAVAVLFETRVTARKRGEGAVRWRLFTFDLSRQLLFRAVPLSPSSPFALDLCLSVPERY